MRALILILLAGLVLVTPAVALEPARVAVLYNRALPESRELAETYAAARDIPADRLVGLDMPDQADISREQYETTIRDPLRRHFDREGWWRRASEPGGTIVLPVENHIRVLAIMRGTPLRIKPTPRAGGAPPADPKNPVATRNEASVDSELALFGLDGVPLDGVLPNRYHRSETAIDEAKMPFFLLTARIDGPDYDVCKRMIHDAVAVEKTGLWGMAYVDLAGKSPQGDAWLEGIVTANRTAGIPTVVDHFKPTLPTHYPMHDAALYFGWYDHHVSGPFRNPHFRFRRGAVAAHIHSFSAAQLENPSRNWCAPLLAAGAAATIGNVYEPYLHLTHHLDILHDRLLRGFTWAEAAWMAMPCASWQGVVLGDPLYRPFAHFPDGGEIADPDIDFRAVAMARKSWPNDDAERRDQLARAVERTRSATLAEALALELIDAEDREKAAFWLNHADTLTQSHIDRIRLVFHQAAMRRHARDTPGALALLRNAASLHDAHPEAKSLEAWIGLLDPAPAANGQ